MQTSVHQIINISIMSKLSIFSIILIFLTACSTMKSPEIIAHRGAAHDAPENTLAAFQLAFEQNAAGIEADFHLTKDREIVCIHDANAKRTSGKDLVIADSTLAELKKLDFGSWKGKNWIGEKIPVLKEVFSIIPDDKKIFIEIKCGPEIIQPLKNIIDKTKLKSEQIVIISFNQNVIKESKKILPKQKTYLLTGFKKDEKNGEFHPTAKELVTILKKINADGADCQGIPQIDEAFVNEIKKAGKEIHIWTIDSPETAKRFRKLGVDSLTSNRPELLKSTFEMRQY